MNTANGFTEAALTPIQEAQYLNEWLPLVHKILKQVSWQASGVIDKDDMEQIALMGLLSSLRRYGIPDEQFIGYASQRIRGAILDELRQHDWRSRRLRQKNYQLNDAINKLVSKLGYNPRPDEICLHLNISPEAYMEYQQIESAKTLQSLDELLSSSTHNSLLGNTFASRELDDEIMSADMLRQALANLDSRELLILTLYYQHEMSLKEIALTLDLTEARVCQINKKLARKIHCFVENQTCKNLSV